MGTAENIEVGDVVKITVDPDDNLGRIGRVTSMLGDFYTIAFAGSPTGFNYTRDQFEWHSADARKEEDK